MRAVGFMLKQNVTPQKKKDWKQQKSSLKKANKMCEVIEKYQLSELNNQSEFHVNKPLKS